MSKRKIIIILISATLLAGTAFFVFHGVRTIGIVSNAIGGEVGVYKNFQLKPEENRVDLLVLGLRGLNTGHGDLLTDAIMLVSFNKETGEAAVVSIPRDLYVELPDYSGKERINFAYPLGERRSYGGGGLALSKQVTSYVTGIYVDYAVSVNFDAFERLVDLLGGVTIYRETAFREDKQFHGEGWEGSEFWNNECPDEDACYWVFEVPEGQHTLNGNEALYYIRSRYTTSDFDRARRQQQLAEAVRAKAISLGVISNPLKVLELLQIVGDNVRTDMSTAEIREGLSIIQEAASANANHHVIDTTNFLESTSIDGQYVLLPKTGDFSEIRAFVKSLVKS